MQQKPCIRMVATDIDGTLVDDQGNLSTFTLSVLRQLVDHGVMVTLVTGLNPWPVKHYIEKLGHSTRAICQNGIFLIEDGNLHESFFVEPSVAKKSVEVIKAMGFVPLVYGADNVTRYISGKPEAMKEVKALIESRAYQPYLAVNAVEELFTVRPAQVSICDTDERAALIFPKLNIAVGDRAYVVYHPAQRAWVEVNHSRARKDIALIALADHMGISTDEIVYFGDSLNDIPVFNAISYPVAVANARPEILDLAWQTTCSNNAHGVAHFLASMIDLHI